MYLNEKQITISVKLLKFIHTVDEFSDVRNFISGYKQLCENNSSYQISEYIEKAIKKNKVNKKIKTFYAENEKIIRRLIKEKMLYNFTSIFFMYNDYLDWFLDELESVDKNKIEQFLTQVEEIGLDEFVFTESKMNLLSYIMIRKDFISNKEEFSTVLTDGDLFLLGKFYNTNFPYYLKNPKYVFEINSNSRKKIALYINTFDVNLPSKEKVESSLTNKPMLDEAKEIKERTAFIRYFFELHKMQEHLTYSKNGIEECQEIEDSEMYANTIQMIESDLEMIKNKISEAEKQSIHYGYNEELLKINLEYMKDYQRSLDYDLD